MTTQVFLDRERRLRYGCFSAVWFTLGFLDFSLPWIGQYYYELTRVIWCGLYFYGLVQLFDLAKIKGAVLSVMVVAISLAVYLPDSKLRVYATTLSFVSIFGSAAWIHYCDYRRSRGYASCVLMAYMVCNGLHCIPYGYYIAENLEQSLVSGYFHYASLNVIALLFAWIHLPREISGKVPVKIAPTIAAIHFWGLIVLQLVINYVLMTVERSSVAYISLVLLMLMLVTTVWVFMVHRHKLAIHTDNVELLLEQRTSSLRLVQVELSEKNEWMAKQLDQQAKELMAKAEIIGRQRRLELAGQTAGGVAHDLENFIHVIDRSMLKMELETDRHSASEELMVHVRSIKRQVKNLYALNQQLLSLSRRGAKRDELVNITEIFVELREMFREHEIKVHTPSNAVSVKGSRSQLLRALVNLCVNAFEASALGGEVSLSCLDISVTSLKQCHMGFLSPGRYTVLTVRDEGVGIPKEVIDRIFEPFYSAGKEQSKRSGSGLGLSVVAGIVDDHRGTIDIDQRDGGCCFKLYFPSLSSPREREVFQNETQVVSCCNSSIDDLIGSFLDGEREFKRYDCHREAIRDCLNEVPDVLLFTEDIVSQGDLMQWIQAFPELHAYQLCSEGEAPSEPYPTLNQSWSLPRELSALAEDLKML
jgi:signal transduction histidine kinase